MTNLAKLREAKGWSQQKLSDISGIQQATICLIEIGQTESPRISTLLKLSRALGCTIDDLVEKEAEPE